jgi:uncharacterized protein YecE (DUF72 family)
LSKHTEVFEQTLALLGTLSEGLEYTSSLLEDGKADEALELVYDVLAGIESITNALKPYMAQFPDSNLNVLEVNMLEGFNKVIEIFKMHQETQLKSFFKNDLAAVFADWRIEIEKLLNMYILS